MEFIVMGFATTVSLMAISFVLYALWQAMMNIYTFNEFVSRAVLFLVVVGLFSFGFYISSLYNPEVKLPLDITRQSDAPQW